MRLFRPRRSTKPVRSRKRPGRRLLLWGLWLTLGFYSLCALNLVYLRWAPPFSTSVQTQRRIESFFQKNRYEKRYHFVPLEQIPVDVQRAVIAAEDGRFYEHNGIDWQEIRKVLQESRPRGRTRGASTISQQLVKNLFLTTHRSVIRKAVEYTVVPLAELILPKKRILELYLNVIEWGPGVYGVEAASRYHYGIPASQLSRDQGARLAACIPAPRSRRPQRMDTYSAQILDRMSSRGW